VRSKHHGLHTVFDVVDLVVNRMAIALDANIVQRREGGYVQGYSHLIRVGVGDQNFWLGVRS
jgi:hypothetical protein